MDVVNIQRIWSISDRLASLRQGVAAGALQSSQGTNHTVAKQDHDQVTDVHRKKIQNILLKQAVVEQAMVLYSHGLGEASDGAFDAYVTSRTSNVEDEPRHSHKSQLKITDDPDKEQRVEFWADYWNSLVYSAMHDLDLGSIGRDFLGWTSLYDGEDIDKNEMNEWLDETIATIMDLCAGDSSHVLEIGSGSGMILFNLVNKVHSYVGVEMSPTAVSFIKEALSSKRDLVDKVYMLQGTAAELSLLEIPTNPDLVIVNSVAQYFPTQQYLLDLIEAIGRIPSVQKAFFGDIRSHALYNEFLFSKAIHDLGDKATAFALRSAMTTLGEREMELLIDPGFFTALSDRFVGLIKHVEILPKCMMATNELSRFRYGVVIHFNRQAAYRTRPDLEIREIDVTSGACFDFVDEGLDKGKLLQRLQASSSGNLLVSNIPNSKTFVDSRLFDIATGVKVPEDGGYDVLCCEWVSAARLHAESLPSMSTLDLLKVAQNAGYKVALSAARQFSQRGGIDAIFYRDHVLKQHDSHSGELIRFRFPTDHVHRDMESMTTHPLRLQARRNVVEQLKESLQAELPVHLIPRRIHVVGKLPSPETIKTADTYLHT